jgi:putative transcriptional regulator
MRVGRCCIAVAFGVLVALASLGARAADVSRPALLVASPELGEFYRGTVLLVRPIGGGRHVGFIINRPTPVTLGSLFPEHAPSQKVTAPVFLGGPLYADVLFAVVHQNASPGGRSLPFTEDVFLALDVDVVDRIIGEDRTEVRYLVGLVAWQPGELDDEIRRSFWRVLAPDAALLFRKSTDGLWEELVRRSGNAV